MPMTKTFKVVTTDDQARIQGEEELYAFKTLQNETPTLESFEPDGDYVILRYSQGLRLAIPESRIKYIAYLDK